VASKQDYYAEFNKHMIPCVITVAQYLCSLFCSRFHLLLFMPLGVAVVLLRSILLVQSIYVFPLDLTHMQKIAKKSRFCDGNDICILTDAKNLANTLMI